jgi:hypothetical protein
MNGRTLRNSSSLPSLPFIHKPFRLLHLNHGRRREAAAILGAHFDRDLFVAGRLEGLGEINHLDVLVPELFPVVFLFREIGRRGYRVPGAEE